MMISLTDLMIFIDTVLIVGGAIYYFNRNYCIIDVETINSAQEMIEDYKRIKESSRELEGGEGGFFKEYIEDDDEEEEEENE